MEEVGLRHFLENLDSFRVMDIQWISFDSKKEIDFDTDFDKEYFLDDLENPESVDLNYFYVETDTYELLNEGPVDDYELEGHISESLSEEPWKWFFYLFLKTIAPRFVRKEGDNNCIYSDWGFLIIKGCKLLRNHYVEDYELSTINEVLLKIFHPKNKEEYINAWKRFDESKEDLTEYEFEN